MLLKKIFYVATCSILGLTTANAQTQYENKVNAYIAKYKDFAIQEQLRTGVPAAIKLAQGIYETAAGNSELAINANNHFGIKCKSNWTGPTYAYTDDAPDECFRVYNDPYQSYKDHSDFLKTNKRYASLFDIAQNDYQSWARGLKKCGYATNPAYAQKIIKIIEENNLQSYTLLASNIKPNNTDYRVVNTSLSTTAVAPLQTKSTSATVSKPKQYSTQTSHLPAPVMEDQYQEPQKKKNLSGDVFADKKNVEQDTQNESKLIQSKINKSTEVEKADFYIVTTKNNLKGYYAKKGDVLLNDAIKHKIRYSKLLEINDLRDEPLPNDMFIYLEKKNKKGVTEYYTVKEDQTLLDIAQEEGLSVAAIRAYNKLNVGEEVADGQTLNLQSYANNKPQTANKVFTNQTLTNKSNYSNSTNGNTANSEEYVSTGKQAPIKDNFETETPITKVAKEKYEVVKEEVKSKVTEAKIATAPIKEKVVNKTTEVYEAAKEEFVEVKQDIKEEVVTTPKKPEKEMTNLEKLKAKMDKSIYGEESKPPTVEAVKSTKSTAKQIKSNDDYVTTPASSQAMLKDKIVNYQESKTNETPKVSKQPNLSTFIPATPESQGVKTKIHTVVKGDTAFSIAKKYNLTVSELVALNNLPTNGSISLGTKLKVIK